MYKGQTARPIFTFSRGFMQNFKKKTCNISVKYILTIAVPLASRGSILEEG